MKVNSPINLKISSINGYKKLKMFQSSNCFKMTSDSLALANFVQIHHRDKKVLDIGTGLGGIPLILSTKGNVHITGVELLEEAVELARRSVSYNHLEDRIDIIHQDIKKFSEQSLANTFDIVVSNPPYYHIRSGYLNISDEISHARHDGTLQLDDIFQIANKLLKNQGRLVLVFTTDRFVELMEFYQKYHFAIKRIQFIHGGEKKCAKTFLIEGTKNGKQGMKVDFPIIFHS